MAVRYSGDVEVRLEWDGRVYQGRMRAPGYKGHGSIGPREAGLDRFDDPASSESYDLAAMAFLRELYKWCRKNKVDVGLAVNLGQVTIRRTFQSPCPVRG
jgi:alpha-L-arabinofuranosidase